MRVHPARLAWSFARARAASTAARNDRSFRPIGRTRRHARDKSLPIHAGSMPSARSAILGCGGVPSGSGTGPLRFIRVSLPA